MSTMIAHPDLRPFPTAGVTIHLLACCYDCKHYHPIRTGPRGYLDALSEWEVKHHGHDIAFLSEKREIAKGFNDRPYEAQGEAPWWLGFASNSNVKLSYAASAAITCDLSTGPLASSSSFLAGRASTALDNTTNLYVDGRLTAVITTGTTPTVDTEIRLYGYAALNDTPTYPDGITGTDANKTLTNAYILDSGLVLIGATAVSSSNNISYPIRCLTVGEAFGMHPKRFGVFVAHNTVAALNATPGNHSINYIGAYVTSV